MNQLLLYFTEEYLELWSVDRNGRLVPVNYQSGNKIPLHFFVNGDKISMDDNARESYKKKVEGSFGHFWKNTGSSTLTYKRFGAVHRFDSILHYALKETVLPSVLKSHFQNKNLSEFIREKRTFVLYDPFVDEVQREIINKGFFEVGGFAPDAVTILDFWDLHRTAANIEHDAYLFLHAALGNIYIHHIGKNLPFHISKKVIEGKGRDPRVDAILDYIAEIAVAKGSPSSRLEIKNEVAEEGPIVLNMLDKGLIIHTIKNENIGINPLKLNFHRSEIESKLNNRQSLNIVQNEFDNYRRKNNAEDLPIYLYGEVINQPDFVEFFNSTYSRVTTESPNLTKDLLLQGFKLGAAGTQGEKSDQIVYPAVETVTDVTNGELDKPISKPVQKESVTERNESTDTVDDSQKNEIMIIPLSTEVSDGGDALTDILASVEKSKSAGKSTPPLPPPPPPPVAPPPPPSAAAKPVSNPATSPAINSTISNPIITPSGASTQSTSTTTPGHQGNRKSKSTTGVSAVVVIVLILLALYIVSTSIEPAEDLATIDGLANTNEASLAEGDIFNPYSVQDHTATSEQRDAATDLINQAKMEIANGNLKGAITTLKESLMQAPTGEAYVMLSDAYFESYDLERSKTTLELANLLDYQPKAELDQKEMALNAAIGNYDLVTQYIGRRLSADKNFLSLVQKDPKLYTYRQSVDYLNLIQKDVVTDNTSEYFYSIKSFYDDLNSRTFDANVYFSDMVDVFITMRNTTPDAINVEMYNNESDYSNSTYRIIGDRSVLTSNDKWEVWILFNTYRSSTNRNQECRIKVEFTFDLFGKINSYSEVQVEDLRYYE